MISLDVLPTWRPASENPIVPSNTGSLLSNDSRPKSRTVGTKLPQEGKLHKTTPCSHSYFRGNHSSQKLEVKIRHDGMGLDLASLVNQSREECRKDPSVGVYRRFCSAIINR